MKTRTAVTLLFVCLNAAAQHQHAPGAEKPVTLLAGMGRHTHPAGTASAEAQKYFDQGLNLLYGFNRYEALRSFRKASELDPKAPLPRWGMAMAQGPHINMDVDGDVNPKESCAALEPARASRDPYVEAAASRCPEYDPARYIAAMRELARSRPDDLDAATLFAEALMIPVRWRWWTTDGRPAEGMEEAVRVLEEVMRRDPNHPGANHFYIHAVEMSPSPERAIPSAQRLMAIVPAAGHLVHMPGHIWLILGEYGIAADVNERAAEVDRRYMAATGVTGSSYAGYYVHNLHFVAVARAMQGQKAAAVKAADFMASQCAPFVESMPGMVDAFLPHPMFARLRFGMWTEALALPRPDARLPASRVMWHYGRGIALLGLGRRAEALREQEELRKAKVLIPADAIWLNNKSSAMAELAGAILQAKLSGREEALGHWRRAVTIQDSLVYDEPPAWYYPVRESLGGALLRAGRAAEAEAVFREGIRRTPRNGRMLFGLAESLQAQGKSDGAAQVRREFDAAWKRADVALTVAGL